MAEKTVISKDKFVAIHYTLKDKDGNVLDSSVGTEPLAFFHGNGYLIAGLEKELEGKAAGDKFSATIEPKDAYGEYDSRLVLKAPRNQFETDMPIEVGMQFQVQTPGGITIVRVIEVADDVITIDGNHELAGKQLNFDIEVVEVRDPTEEELAQLSMQGCSGNCGGCGGGCGGLDSMCQCDGEGGECGGCGGNGCGNCGE
ncbi:MAG: peptidylprolyl isomerase [Treponema sp.]|nr:peptidylprolyl isomerase [Treponema sp.]